MSWLSHNWRQVIELTVDHLAIAFPAVALTAVIAIPVGWAAQRWPRAGQKVVGGASLLYSVPALPLLIIIPAILGTSLRSSATVVIALVIYGVAIMVRSAADAFGAVDASVRRTATAMGFTPIQLFWRIDLPLATPLLVAGLRVVSVSTISMATIGALVGIPSLGSLLTDGFQRGIVSEVVCGVIGTVVVALTADALLAWAGRAATPWARVSSGPVSEARR